MRLHLRDVYIFLFFAVALALVNPSIARADGWHTVSLPARPMNIIASHGALWVCGVDELIANSADGGKTWNVVHSLSGGAVLLSIGFTDERFGYAAGTGGILVTEDGGTTWKRLSTPVSLVYAAAFGDPKHGVIHTPHAVYTTSDGGATWSPVDLNFSDEQGKYSYVLGLAAPDTRHMMIVASVGNAAYYAESFLVTSDGGATWKPTGVPNSNPTRVSAYDGEYWFAGSEVIEKDKPGGGYGVPLVMHSKDGENWTRLARPPRELASCEGDSCLYWDGAGVTFSATSAAVSWTFPSEKAVTAKWAFAKDAICSVGATLRCATVTMSDGVPTRDASAWTPIPEGLAPPPLDAPEQQGPRCIICGFEHVVVTNDYAGKVEVALTLHLAMNGTVTDVDVDSATRPEIGQKLATEARNWVFVPFEQDGTVHPVLAHVRVQVQAIRSR